MPSYRKRYLSSRIGPEFVDAEAADTFRNQWQSYRTRANRTLELEAQHDYDEPGLHTVLVKVVDIFGNDTTTAVPVTVK